jgi:predicted MFS family arabinose efflux permease
MAGPASAAGASEFLLSDDIRRRRNYALLMLMLVYMSSHIDRGIVGILVEPIKKDLNLSYTQMGILSGLAFAVFYATLGIPLAILADRANRRNIIVVALTTWSAMTVVCGLAQNYTQLLLARIGVGIGEAGSSPQSHSMISDMYAPHERARALGFYSLGVTFGGMLGALVGGYVSVHWGWRAAFFVVGAPGILLALIVYLTVPEPPRLNQVSRPEGANAWQAMGEGFKFIWASHACRHVIAGLTLTAFVGYGASFFGAAFLETTHKIPRDQIGLILGPVAGLVGGAGILVGGYFADKWGKSDARWTAWVVAIGKIIAFPLILAYYLSEDFWVAVAFLLPGSFFGTFYLGPAFAMVQSVSPPAMRATTAAIALFILNLVALGLGPTVVGFASDVLNKQFNLGTDSLRYALAGASCLNLWAAAHFYWAAEAYAKEFKTT